MNTITINKKEYEIRHIEDFNDICEFDELGISFSDIQEQNYNFSLLRKLAAYVMRVDIKTAGLEITEHLKNGGKMEDLTSLTEVIDTNSAFLKSLLEQN